ncbi:MAG: recombinase family protein [Pseudomonadota bacterium]
MSRAAIYARYSSDLQSASSIDDQVRLCRERLDQEGHTAVDVFSDYAISGGSLKARAGMQALLTAAQAGRIDVVYAEALDRVSRDQEDIAAIYKRLAHADVHLITLAEGEISELHIGLKGTMNALFLKDLAQKTKRGQRGRVEAGKIAGGNSYGYRVVHKLLADGTPVTGEREIDPAQATIVRRIFDEYASGLPPRRIVTALNAEGIPGPRGGAWNASTINGSRQRRKGILNNELYLGRVVWNRQRFLKDPETGKRVSRPNPESAWITADVPELQIIDDDLWNRLRYVKDPETGRRVSRLNLEADWIIRDVPDLRIIPQDLWDRVKTRQAAAALPQRSNRGAAMGRVRRARYLFSGMPTCGVCGGGMSVILATHVGCSAARNKGTCANRKTIARREIEDRVLGALEHRLMDPKLFTVFCEAFTDEMNRLRRATGDQRETHEKELAKIDRDLERLVQALMDGIPAAAVKAKMETLEARKAEIETNLKSAPEHKPALHPAMAEIYRTKVERLSVSLSAPDLRAEAVEILRGLVETITLTPEEDRNRPFWAALRVRDLIWHEHLN